MTKIESIHSWVEKEIRLENIPWSVVNLGGHLQESNFSKGLTKLAILPGYKSPRNAFLHRRKVQKLDF